MDAEKRPWIETPLVRSATLSRKAGCNIYLKLENLQPSGSFKSRGVGNFMLAELAKLSQNVPNGTSDNPSPEHKAHFYSSSGGNAGLACVHAAVTLSHPATIVVPMSTTAYMISKLHDAGASSVIQYGASWAEADRHLVHDVLSQARTRGEEPIYVPPFDAPAIWEGNATMLSEIARQLEAVGSTFPTSAQEDEKKGRFGVDAVICSVGGGGLFCGVMQGLDSLSVSKTKVIAVETRGADSLSQSVEQNEIITLPAITSIATSLGARRVCEQAFKYACDQQRVRTVVLTDKQAVQACRDFANDERMLVEPACGVGLAVCYQGMLPKLIDDFGPYSRVVVVVCGGSNISLDVLEKYVGTYI